MFVRISARQAISYFLALSLLGLLAATVSMVNLFGSFLFFGCLLFALVNGEMVGRSIFSRSPAFVYILVMSVLSVFLVESRALPFRHLASGSNWSETLWLMNLRALVYLDHGRTWLEIILNGDWPQSTSSQAFLVLLISWLTCTELGRRLARKKEVFVVVALLAVLVGLITYFGKLNINYLVMCACVGILLSISSVYQQLHYSWDTHRIDYAEMDYEWMFAAGLVTILVAGLMIIFPAVGTPHGWQEIADQVEEMTNELRHVPSPTPHPQASYAWQFTPIPTPVGSNYYLPGSGNEADTFPLTVWNFNLESMQLPVGPDSNETVLWVYVSEPPQRGNYYWRSMVYDYYDGQGWRQVETYPQIQEGAKESGFPSGEFVEQRFEVGGSRLEVPVALPDPIFVSEGMDLVYSQPDGSVFVIGDLANYNVISMRRTYLPEDLRNAGQEYTEEITKIYLQVPDSLPARVKNLATRIAAPGETPYDKAELLTDYLRNAYPYTLDLPQPPVDQDLVDYFLFDAPGGFCSYYASALAVMLRTQNIPARIASGFSSGIYHEESSAYRVPGSAFHAWVEVYFPGYGWVEFEPTANRPLNENTPFETDSATSEPSLFARLMATIITIGYRVYPVLVLGGIVGFILLARREIRQRPRTPLDWTDWLYASAWHFVDRRSGVAISTTPWELYARIKDRFPGRLQLHNAAEMVIDVHVKAVYSACLPDYAVIREARRQWRRTFLIRLHIRAAGCQAQISRDLVGFIRKSRTTS